MNNKINFNELDESQIFNVANTDRDEPFFFRKSVELQRNDETGDYEPVDVIAVCTEAEGQPIFGEFSNTYLEFESETDAQDWLDSMIARGVVVGDA